jgi:hypothetical protein
MTKKKLVFILGTAHCGSTLLSLILGSHSRCFNVGEISNLPRLYNNNKPICSICEGECSFWDREFSKKELEMLSTGLSNCRVNKFIPLKMEKFYRELINDQLFKPYSLVASKTDADVIIDSTKTLYWIENGLKLKELNSSHFETYILYIVRDGRAVLNSYLKRDKSLTIEKFSDLWKKRVQANEVFFEKFAPEKKLKLAYESFATNPEETIKNICTFLNINYLPEIIQYWKYNHHIISGNIGTKSLIKKYRQSSYSEQPTDFKIELDLKWQTQLTPEQIKEFYSLIGNINEQYEWN